MKKNEKPREETLTATAATTPGEEMPRKSLRIEELEACLAPQSTTTILD